MMIFQCSHRLFHPILYITGQMGIESIDFEFWLGHKVQGSPRVYALEGSGHAVPSFGRAS